MSVKLEDIVSLAKRRGFIFPGSEIYGGLAGTFDYGPLGMALKRNIRDAWLKYFVDGWDDMYLIDSAILMNSKVWQASGHASGFNDPMVVCSNCHSSSRADHIKDDKCPVCGKTGTLGKPRQFNMMFKTHIGPVDDEASVTYLRPETAQGMFTNFKNIVDTYQPDLPFGLAQIGKAFRNEISPRDFLFRVRELEIMEFEFFIEEKDWEKYFEKWQGDFHKWFKYIGLDESKIKEIEVPAEDRAHYSKRTIDFHYEFPSLGFEEIAGLAYRTDFDLQSHQKASGKNLEYRPKDGGKPFIPHVIEPTWGLDRHVLAVLANAYSEDEQGGEKRVFLKLPPKLAPIKVAVCPLAKNKPELVEKAREIYKQLKKEVDGEVMWTDTGNIGKNYRRADEIGVPKFITVDFQTLDDDTVTIRDRDTTEQKRVKTNEILTRVSWN